MRLGGIFILGQQTNYCIPPTPRATPLPGPLALTFSYKSPKKYNYVHRPGLNIFTKFLGECAMCTCAQAKYGPKWRPQLHHWPESSKGLHATCPLCPIRQIQDVYSI